MTGTEPIYSSVDALYRLHEDLFHVETEIARGHRLAIRLARMRTEGMIGTMVAGLLAIVPIFVEIAGITFTSAPAIVVYVVLIGLIALWWYQGHEANEAQRELGSLAQSFAGLDLKDRPDYMFETVNAYSVRAKLADQILDELQQTIASAAEEQQRAEAQKRRDRYVVIRDYCMQRIKAVVASSEAAVLAKRRTEEEHERLRQWAAARLGEEVAA